MLRSEFRSPNRAMLLFTRPTGPLGQPHLRARKRAIATMTDRLISGEPNVIAIDIGGGSTKLALVDRHGEIRNWRSFPTQCQSGPEFIDKVLAASLQLQTEADIDAFIWANMGVTPGY